MKTRTYEFYKVGYKVNGETEYTILNTPFLKKEDAALDAQVLCRNNKCQTCVARFQIIEVNTPDDVAPTLAEKIADDIRNGTFGTEKKSPSAF